MQATPLPPSQRTELPIPRALDDLVLSCLEKDPGKRPQDAGALFRLATECLTCSAWNHDTARTWWEAHLPELTGSAHRLPTETADRSGAHDPGTSTQRDEHCIIVVAQWRSCVRRDIHLRLCSRPRHRRADRRSRKPAQRPFGRNAKTRPRR